MSYNCVSDRIINKRIKFQKKNMTITGIYAPEEGKEEESIEFYDLLQRQDKKSITGIREQLCIFNINDKLTQYKINWREHIQRMDDNRIKKNELQT